MNAPFRFAMLVVTIITIIENGAIVAFTFVFREVRNVPQSALIVSMSVADLLIGMIVMPLALYYEFNVTWELGLIVCDFWISADIMCSTASILSIAFISIDKYFSLIHSSRYFGRERLRWVRLFVGVTWATATFVAFSAGASGWARAKPLPPRDFHADLDQVIADWPMRVNFSNISLRQALEYVENLESDAANQPVDEECTITNNPIFALYSGMVSFYLPAAAILYFSCKIRWISALTLARHERITTQRMKMMKNRAKKRKNSIFIGLDGEFTDEQGEEPSGATGLDDDATFQEYSRISSRAGPKLARRSAMGLRAVGRQHSLTRRAGLVQAVETAFADELFSESGTHNDMTTIGEQDGGIIIMPGVSCEVPQNSTATFPSMSSMAAVGNPHRTVRTASCDRTTRGPRLHSWGESTYKHHHESWFKRLHNSNLRSSQPTSIIAINNSNIMNNNNVFKNVKNNQTRSPGQAASGSTYEASPTTTSNSKRATLQYSAGGFEIPSSIRYIDETSFTSSERPQRGDSSSCHRRSSQLRQRSSFRVLGVSTFYDDISLRYIDESTITSSVRADVAADLLPLPSLPPGVIVPVTQQSRRSIFSANYNGTVDDNDRISANESPALPFHVPLPELPTQLNLLESNLRRSTGGSSFRNRATSILSKLRSTNTSSAQNQQREGGLLRSSSLRRKISRLSNRLKHVDAGGHLSAIGEYRSYMKALRRKERRTATLWLVTVITFLGCWAPFFFCYPLSCFIEVPIELMILLPWLGYANSTINPVLHAFVEPVYLKSLAKFILSLLPAHWL